MSQWLGWVEQTVVWVRGWGQIKVSIKVRLVVIRISSRVGLGLGKSWFRLGVMVRSRLESGR